MVLVILVGLVARDVVVAWATSIRYQASFRDAGGLAAGNDVTISGIKVGSVSDVALQGRNALVTFTHRRHGRTRFGHHRTRADRHASR